MQNSDAAFLARSQLVGLSKAQVVACAGQPERTETAVDSESLSYSASSGETGYAPGSGGSLLTQVRRSCEVVFVLRRGYVQDVKYVGERTGGVLTPGEECLPIVKKCASLR
jgi:hypothetical protein